MARSMVEISRLRDFGWSLWDPIGLGDSRNECPDEYDRYLIHTFSSLQDGASEEDCVNYLVWVESEHMGLGSRPGAADRAKNTVSALRTYLAEI